MSCETSGYGEGGYGEGGYGTGFISGIFPVTFDHIYPLEIHYATEIFEREDGTEKRRALMHVPLHVFEGLLFAQSEAARDCLEDFFDARRGTDLSFTFTDPLTSTEHTVRFETDSLVFRRRPDTLWDIKVRLYQVL